LSAKLSVKLNYSAPALDRGLDILELLSVQGKAQSLGQMSLLLNRGSRELLRLLNCLVSRNFVFIEQASGKYALSLKMFELAHLQSVETRLLSCAIPFMHTLVETLEQSCHLVVQKDRCLSVITQIAGPGPWNFSVKAGASVAVTTSASGRVLLAFSKENQRRKLLDKQLLNRHSNDASLLETELDSIVEAGYAQRVSEQVSGVTSISAPIQNYNAEAVGALTIPYVQKLTPADKEDFTTARNELMRCARAISLALGMGAMEAALST